MRTEAEQLWYYMVQLRRIAAHREAGAEQAIRLIYQDILQKLFSILGRYYTAYGTADAILTRGDLQAVGQYKNFLQDVLVGLDGVTPEVQDTIRQAVEETYTTCYNGMAAAVQKSNAANPELSNLLQGLSATTPETVRHIVEHPMENLTLSTVLNRQRKQVVTDIKKTIAVGLANGDSYTRMAQRIADSVGKDYRKAMRIVRTEANRAINRGFQDVSEEASDLLLDSEYVEVKEWCSMEDESVRNTHRHLNGKVVHAMDVFHSGGATAECPGDFGVPEEDINCRCFLAYRFLKREDFLAQGGVIPKAILEKEQTSQDEYESEFVDKIRRTAKSTIVSGDVYAYDNLPEQIYEPFEAGLLRCEPETKRALETVLKKADIHVTSDRNSYFKLLNVINIREDAPSGTLAHETFHMIDLKYGINKKHDLSTPLQKDWNALLTRSNGDVLGYLTAIYPEAFKRNILGEPILKKEYRGISDIISGLTKDKINLGYHHSKEYWSVKGALIAESWAQFGRISYDNDEFVQKMFSEVFTNFRKYAILYLKEVI